MTLTRRRFIAGLAAVPLAVKAFIQPSQATVAEFQTFTGPVIISGIDFTSAIQRHFDNGAIAVKIYGRGPSPFIRIDRDGTITQLKENEQ